MKERMRLEKEKKNENKGVDPKAQQKRKHPEEDKENQKRKKKKQESTESAKDKEEKRKKKEQEKERQRMMLEARRAQAISRWVTSTTTTADDDEVAIVNDLPNATFTPQPFRRNSSLNLQSPMISAHTAYSLDRTPNTTPESVQSTMQESPATNLALPASSSGTKSRTPNSSVIATPESMQLKHRSSAANPRPPGAKTKRTCEPKRGLHFQSAIAEDSDDEIEEEEEGILEDADVSNTDCCKEQRMEIKALRKRLEKVHKRLNIACKLPLPKLDSFVFSSAHTHTHTHIHMDNNTKLSTFSSTQCTCKATKMKWRQLKLGCPVLAGTCNINKLGVLCFTGHIKG